MSEIISCTHKVTLDIAKRDVHMIQVIYGDTANILEVNLCENGKEISLENATLATITYSNDTFDEMQISEDYRTASARINANCLKQGLNFAQISIYSGDNGLITADMLTIDCNQKIGGDNPSCPNADMPKLKELINQLIQQGMADGISPEQIADAVANYLAKNPIEETDPNVHEWAKAKEKPTYTAEEVGALSDKTLKPAVSLALAQAKASGEFDGADGLTPTIGENGNWYLGDTDTGKPSRGDTGAAGKSAYQYAYDGGYTGTEAAFSEKLAQEQLTGTTGNLTPTQVYEAVSAGIPVKVQYTDSTYGLLSFTAFNVFESLSVIVSETIAYFNGLYILIELLGDVSGNTWGHMATTLAQKSDIPLKLPNPNALTFTGAAEGSYDGSEALSVEIPSGSGASEGSSQWKIIRDLTITENADRVDINKDNDGNTFALHEIHVFSYTQSYADSSEAYTFLLNGFWNVGDPYFYSGFKSTASSSDYYAKNHFIATMQNGFANIFQPWKAYIVGTNNNRDVFSFGDKYQTIESVSFVGKFIAGCRFILVGRVTL